MTYGHRLRNEIKRAGMTIRDFQQQMQEQGVRGGSHASVHAYLKDRRLPTLKFNRVASYLLGVRESWLLYGEGERKPIGRSGLDMKRSAKVGVGGSRRIMGQLLSGLNFNILLEHADFVRLEDGGKITANVPLIHIVLEIRGKTGEIIARLDLGHTQSATTDKDWKENFHKIRAVLDEAEDQLGMLFLAFESRRMQEEERSE